MGMNGCLLFTIIFTPQFSEEYNTVAYLEIAGKQERIPLKLRGTGLGPEFKLNIGHLDANNIFLRSIHDYEIIVSNTGNFVSNLDKVRRQLSGHIPGSLTFMERELQFGGRIQCEPETLYVNADHYNAFLLSFTPGEEGRFVEKVEFVINESKEVIHFIMT